MTTTAHPELHASRRGSLGSALILVFAVAVVSPAAAQRTVERMVEAAPDGTVEVHNVAGSVVVTGWERQEVQVTGRLGRAVEALEVEGHGRRTTIAVKLPRRSHRGGDADLEIRVPRGSSLRVEGVSADVEVSEVDGRVTLRSVSGGLRVEGQPASVSVEGVSGTIELEGPMPDVQAESVSGTLVVAGEIDELDASVVSGDLHADVRGLRRGRFEAVSGDVEITASLAGRGSIDAASHSGNVELALPGDTSAKVRAGTFSGRIRNDLGPAARRTGRYTPGEELEFTLGGGDGEIQLKTFSGDISLHPR